MKKDNYIYAYYQQIKTGTITVGAWIMRLYEKIIKDLDSKVVFFDKKKADDAIEWMENHAFHVEGSKAPNKIEFELWQKAFLSCVYGLCDENGHLMFREIVLIMARKNGKSLLASAMGKYNWFLQGGYGAKVYVIAPKLDQADIVYNTIWHMTQLDPEWQVRKQRLENARKGKKGASDDLELARHRQTDLYIPGTNSMVKKIAFSSKKSDGFNPSFCICDEVAAWEGDKGLKQYEVMKSGMGARDEAQILSCSTAGYINESIYDELIKRSTRFLLGDSKERRLLPFLYMIDDVEKWDDINELQKSNPNLGVSVSVDYLLEEIAVAQGSLSKKAEFITKYCNIKQNSSLAWLSSETVEKASGEALSLEDFRESYCIAGIDLSQTTDLTACCIVIEKDEELYVFSKFFLPSEKIDEATLRDGLPYQTYIQRGLLDASGENFIDYRDVFRWFQMLVEEYQIFPLQVGYDRYSSQYLIQDMETYGFHCDDVWQGENLYGVIQETEGLLKDGKIHIGDNDLMKVHLLNSAIKMSTERGRGKLVKLSASSHIDGTASLLDAMTVRQKYYQEIGGQLQNRG